MIVHPDFAWLAKTAFNDYSQFGEDGVLQAIFSVIKPANEWCFECGAADGLFFSNTRRLIEQGWHAVLVEADAAAFRRLEMNSANFRDRVTCCKGVVGSTYRIDATLHGAGAPLDIDLVVIDVDGQDYHLFNQMFQYRPRVVVIEFDRNADDEFIPPIGAAGQAGRIATQRLALGKFYELVYANIVNGIFVQHSLSRLLRGHPGQILKASGNEP